MSSYLSPFKPCKQQASKSFIASRLQIRLAEVDWSEVQDRFFFGCRCRCQRTRPVMSYHALVVSGNAWCHTGLMMKLVHPVELNSWRNVKH